MSGPPRQYRRALEFLALDIHADDDPERLAEIGRLYDELSRDDLLDILDAMTGLAATILAGGDAFRPPGYSVAEALQRFALFYAAVIEPSAAEPG